MQAAAAEGQAQREKRRVFLRNVWLTRSRLWPAGAVRLSQNAIPFVFVDGTRLPALAGLGSVAHSAVLSRTQNKLCLPLHPAASLWTRSWDWQHQNQFLAFSAKHPWQWAHVWIFNFFLIPGAES